MPSLRSSSVPRLFLRMCEHRTRGLLTDCMRDAHVCVRLGGSARVK